MNNVMFGVMAINIWEMLLVLLSALFVAAVVGGIVLLVVWLARRGQRPASVPPPVQDPPPPPPQPGNCPRCGAVLPPDSPQGLCPRCVLEAGFATQTEAGEAVGPNGTKIVKPPAPSCEEVARHFPQLEILECLGQGGMGVVYKARQPKLNRLVALKILAPEKGADPKFAGRFLREAQALARLSHPNIVTVHDFGEANGMFFLLMEYVDGLTLRQLLREKRMKPEEALAIVPRICEALQFAHEQGIVHRDIKPENVLLDKQGRVKIADFGIAKIVGHEQPQQALTQEQQIMGTPHYMAPEQVEKPSTVDHRADIYSLGVVFYEMLTGELPLGKFQPPSKKVQIDVRLDEVVLHALEKEPERRYQQASEVKTAVERIQTPSPDSLQLPPPPSASWEAARTRVQPLSTALIVLGMLGLIISMLVQVRGYSSNSLDFSLGAFGYWRLFLPANCAAFLAGMEPLLRVLNLVVLVGALRMRRLESYWLAIAGAASAMVTPPLLPLGLPVGAWALLVLSRKDVRREFAMLGLAGKSFVPAAPGFSRLAVISGFLAGISLLGTWFGTGMGVLGARPYGGDSSGLGWSAIATVLIWIETWPFLGTMFLGGVALEDICRAKGRLKGAGLASFALLFMPLYWVLTHALEWMAEPIETTADSAAIVFLASTAALVLCGGLAFWMYWTRQRRTAAVVAGSARNARPLPKWEVRTLQSVAVVLVVLNLFWVGFIPHLAQSWSDDFDTLLTAFDSHAVSHPKPGVEVGWERFSAALPTGDVELLSVSDLSSSSPSPVCWRPDGGSLCRMTNVLAESTRAQSRPRLLALSLHFPDSFVVGRILPFELRVAGKPVASRHWSMSASGTFVLFSAPPGASQMDFRIGEPAGEWLDTDAGWVWDGRIPRHPERIIRRSGQQAVVTLGQVQELSGVGTSVGWMSRSFPKDWVGRVVAVDASGVVHEPISATTSLNDVAVVHWKVQSDTFGTLPPARIKELRLQIRNSHWVDFHSISLKSGHRTAPEVSDADEAMSASDSPAIGQNYTFGPVIERVLPFDDKGVTDLLDLDSGRVLQPQPRDSGVPALFTAAGVSFTLAENIMLTTSNLAVQAANDGWDSFTAGQAAATAEKLQLTSAFSAESVLQRTLPKTFLFKTRAGGRGILQVTGYTDKPRSVKLRYKLVQSDKPQAFQTPAALNPAKAEQAVLDFGGEVVRDATGKVVKVNLIYAQHDPQGNPIGNPNPNTSDEVSPVLPAFDGLKELMLYKGQASDRAMRFVGSLTNLEVLGLSYPTVTDEGLKPIAGLTSLRALYVLNSHLRGSGLQSLQNLPQLEKLALQGNEFQDHHLLPLLNMPQLRSLRIGSGHYITDFGLRYLANLKELEELELQDTKITDKGLKQLHGLKRLKKLYVANTGVTPAGIRAIQAAIPGLQVDDGRGAVLDKRVSDASPAGLEPSFGPEIERTLPLSNLGYSHSLNLESGEMQQMPAGLTMADWSRITLPNGIIVIAPSTNRALTVAGTGTQVMPLLNSAESWDHPKPPQLDIAYKLKGKQTISVTGESSSPPVTFAFKTKSGARGLLQITGFTENPRGVKIRYKLVRPAGQGTSGSSASSHQNAVTESPAEPARTTNMPPAETVPAEVLAALTSGLLPAAESLQRQSEQAERAVPREPAQSAQSLSSVPAKREQLMIAADGTISLAGEPCPPHELPERLKQLAARHPVVVEIRADKDAPFKIVASVTEACKTAGIESVTLASRPSQSSGATADAAVKPAGDEPSPDASKEVASVPASPSELIARYEAAKSIRSFVERDSVLAAVATDAARAGDWAMSRKALSAITSFTARDEAAHEAARLLAKFGRRAEAADIAKMITSFTKRDAALKELSQ